MKWRMFFSAGLATLLAGSVSLGQAVSLSTMGVSTLSSPPSIQQVSYTPELGTHDDSPALTQELAEECLRCWQGVFRRGEFQSAQGLAEKAAQLNPANLAARHACLLSQLMNAFRNTGCCTGSAAAAQGSCPFAVCRPELSSAYPAPASSAGCEVLGTCQSQAARCCSKDCACDSCEGCCKKETKSVRREARVVTSQIIVIPTVLREPAHPMGNVFWMGPQPVNFGMVPPPPPVCHPVLPTDWTAPMPPAQPALLHVAADDHRITLAAHGMEAQCQRMTFLGSRDKVLLEGNVRLTCRKDGSACKIEAQRLVLDLNEGTFTVETGRQDMPMPHADPLVQPSTYVPAPPAPLAEPQTTLERAQRVNVSPYRQRGDSVVTPVEYRFIPAENALRRMNHPNY